MVSFPPKLHKHPASKMKKKSPLLWPVTRTRFISLFGWSSAMPAMFVYVMTLVGKKNSSLFPSASRPLSLLTVLIVLFLFFSHFFFGELRKIPIQIVIETRVRGRIIAAEREEDKKSSTSRKALWGAKKFGSGVQNTNWIPNLFAKLNEGRKLCLHDNATESIDRAYSKSLIMIPHVFIPLWIFEFIRR